MRTPIAIAIAALIIAAISVWLNIDWKKRYEDCDAQKRECYKACTETWDAEKAEFKQRIEFIDSVEREFSQDTFIDPRYWLVLKWRDKLHDDRLDALLRYHACRVACEEQWERCTGEE